MKRCFGLGLLLLVSSAAWADFEASGDPFFGGSWGQSWILNDFPFGQFDTFVFRIVTPGETFESPAITNFRRVTFLDPVVTGWSQRGQSSLEAVASGSTRWSLKFDTMFNGTPIDDFEMDFAAYSASGKLLRTALLHAVGTWEWEINLGSWDPGRDYDPPPSVPVPAAVLLGFVGVGLVGSLKRRIA